MHFVGNGIIFPAQHVYRNHQSEDTTRHCAAPFLPGSPRQQRQGPVPTEFPQPLPEKNAASRSDPTTHGRQKPDGNHESQDRQHDNASPDLATQVGGSNG